MALDELLDLARLRLEIKRLQNLLPGAVRLYSLLLKSHSQVLEMIFNELEDYVMESIDIINIAKKSLELEKLKYILLSKDQLALFNYYQNLNLKK